MKSFLENITLRVKKLPGNLILLDTILFLFHYIVEVLIYGLFKTSPNIFKINAVESPQVLSQLFIGVLLVISTLIILHSREIIDWFR